MQKERIRVLVDRSRDAGWSDALIDIEPDDVYQITDNRNYLKWSVLKNYDVLTMCGYPVLPYRNDEMQAVKKFVELGGGLLLASSTGRFERDIGKPISEMQLNKIARIFGAEFLPLDVCKTEIEVDHNSIHGYRKENLYLADRLVFADLYLDDIPFSNCGTISIPDGADVVIRHNETLEPVSACIRFGKGRMLIINEITFSQCSFRTCNAFLDWLGSSRFSKVSGDEQIPDEIPVDEYVKEDGDIRIHYNSFVPRDRADMCLSLSKRMKEYINNLFPDEPCREWKIELTPSCNCETSLWQNHPKGAFMSDSMLAYAVGGEGLWKIPFYDTLAYNVFGHRVFSKYCGIMGMRLLGFDAEADRMYYDIIRQFKEEDPTGTEIDITKIYHYHHKLVWILTTLTDKYGHDLFARLQKNIPKPDEFWNRNPYYKPRKVFSPLDIFIYYLSLTLGEDMYLWFRKIGTTVHELPLYKEDTDEFKNGVCQYLKNIIRDKSASASDRDNAIQGLINVKEKYDLASDDKYDRIVSAIKLSQSCDSRAVPMLKELIVDKDDLTISAIASLTLVQLEDTSNVKQLIDIAKSLDHRFQLNAYHSLNRIGYDFEKSVVDTEIEYDGVELKVYATAGGYRVAHVFTLLDCGKHFQGNTHITGVYIDWVSTEPMFRRIGLSSLAIQRTFTHPSIQRCSCAFLNTGIENPAHAMYRSFGFVDMSFMETFSLDLHEEKVYIPDDFVLRSYSPMDEVRMADLANEYYSNFIDIKRIKVVRQKDNIIKIAERNGEILGYVFASMPTNREAVQLRNVCLKNIDERNKIGLILLRSLHNDLLARGFRSVVFWDDFGNKEDLRGLFNELGYNSHLTSGVKMFKLINLPMLLDEIVPLLTKRLLNSDYKGWQGKIGISGNQHKATIIIDDEISIAEEAYNDVNIHLTTDDDTITRIVIGKLTPYEAYLQSELSIKPIINDGVANLFKTLFPKIPN